MPNNINQYPYQNYHTEGYCQKQTQSPPPENTTDNDIIKNKSFFGTSTLDNFARGGSVALGATISTTVASKAINDPQYFLDKADEFIDWVTLDILKNLPDFDQISNILDSTPDITLEEINYETPQIDITL